MQEVSLDIGQTSSCLDYKPPTGAAGGESSKKQAAAAEDGARIGSHPSLKCNDSWHSFV